MLVNTFGKKKIYNPEDHLFIFLSLLYALTIHFTIQNISIVTHDTYVHNDPFWLNSIMVFGWNVAILALAAESWWGTWGDKRQFSKDFKRFIILLVYPILLSLASKSLSHLPVIEFESEFHHNDYIFFLVYAILLFMHLIYIRWYIDRNTDHIQSRIIFLSCCGVLAFISFINATPDGASDTNATLKLIILSVTTQIFGIIALLSFVKTKRNNLYNKEKLEQTEFLNKISDMANLPYRHGTPFSFFVIKLKDTNINNSAKFDYILDTIVKGTRGYHLCSHLTDHIAIFIPYIDMQDQLSLDQLAENLEKNIENRIRKNPKTKDIKIITGINISKFDQQRIDEISSNSGRDKGALHIGNLNNELKIAYKSACKKADCKENTELAKQFGISN